MSMVSIRIKAMECLCPNSQSLAAAPTCLGSVVLIVALTLVPPGKSQMLMNLAPQALPNSPVGPAYTGTLDAVKQRLNTPGAAPIQSTRPQAPASRSKASPSKPFRANNTASVGEVCELKVSQMNDIQHRKVVRVHSGSCLMVFNAND